MSEIRFYTDEHIARAVVRGLRQRGVDVLTVPEAGLMGAPDVPHLRFAVRTQRVTVTQLAHRLRTSSNAPCLKRR